MGYDELEEKIKAYDDGKITKQEFDQTHKEWVKQTRSQRWQWFPTFKGFTELIDKFRKQNQAILVYACTKRDQYSLRGGTEFETYKRIFSPDGEHIAILGKPSWYPNKKGTTHR